MKVWVVIGWFLLLPDASLGADLQLAGHALGETLARAKADARFDCGGQALVGFSATCQARQPKQIVIGAVALQSLALHFDGEQLAAMEARLPEPRHERALQALAAAYGEAQAETEKLRAGMGGIFSNAIYVWRQGQTLLRLEQFFRNINTSSIILTTEAQLGKLVMPKPTDARTGIKDL